MSDTVYTGLDKSLESLQQAFDGNTNYYGQTNIYVNFWPYSDNYIDIRIHFTKDISRRYDKADVKVISHTLGEHMDNTLEEINILNTSHNTLFDFLTQTYSEITNLIHQYIISQQKDQKDQLFYNCEINTFAGNKEQHICKARTIQYMKISSIETTSFPDKSFENS